MSPFWGPFLSPIWRASPLKPSFLGLFPAIGAQKGAQNGSKRAYFGPILGPFLSPYGPDRPWNRDISLGPPGGPGKGAQKGPYFHPHFEPFLGASQRASHQSVQAIWAQKPHPIFGGADASSDNSPTIGRIRASQGLSRKVYGNRPFWPRMAQKGAQKGLKTAYGVDPGN